MLLERRFFSISTIPVVSSLPLKELEILSGRRCLCFLPPVAFSDRKTHKLFARVLKVSVRNEIDSASGDSFFFSRIANYDSSGRTVANDNERIEEENEDQEVEEDEQPGISKIRVSRQKYISISKSVLLDTTSRSLFESHGDDVAPFPLVASLLDSVLHAEHKAVLEELRNDYAIIEEACDEIQNEGKSDSPSDTVNKNGSARPSLINYSWKFDKILGYSTGNGSNPFSDKSNKLAVAARFQGSFMQLLDNAQFHELSEMDLTLASSLNSDYILTLPIYVDWKKTSEANAIIFRRGYTTERQEGLMIAEKLDYLQSRFLQKIFSSVSKPLRKFGSWMKMKLSRASDSEELSDLLKRMATWQEDSPLLQLSLFNSDRNDSDLGAKGNISQKEFPIWLAAQKAVARYEGFLSPVGPRGRLLRRLITQVGFVPPLSEDSSDLETDDAVSEPHLRPILLSRISLADIWKPATSTYCGENFWKRLRTSFSILLSPSVLQEPAFKELILLYTKDVNSSITDAKSLFSPLQLKIYERIPIPDLPVVFPNRKLSFRILDTVRLDLATIIGLLAFFINYKFEDILSSPSAFILDFVAISALILYVSRVALGYKRTWDRYQLLVNKTLYEKTLASGFGSVYFLLDASEQQQYKEALVAYAVLLKSKDGQVACRGSLALECERFLYDAFKLKVEMPIDEALSTLARLSLAKEDAGGVVQAVPCEMAVQSLRQRWNDLLSL